MEHGGRVLRVFEREGCRVHDLMRSAKINSMKQEPPDIETCKSIVNSSRLRTDRSIGLGIALLAVAGLWTWWGLSHTHLRVIEGSRYIATESVLFLTGGAIFFAGAYRRFVVKKEDRALYWLATDHLSRHNAAVTARNAEQVVAPNGP